MLFVAAALVTAALIAAELLARWWLRHRRLYYVFPPGMRVHLRPDPEVFPELERFVRFEINGEGERGSEVPRLRAGERLYRVLVGGGSQPEGYLLDQATSWPGALQGLLATPGSLARLAADEVHVGSIARSGVGAEALDLILRRVLPRYPRLQAMVILVGASDVLRWLEQGAPAAPPAPATTAEVFRCHPEADFAWRPGRLALYEQLTRLRRRWLRPVDFHERAGRWIGQARAARGRAADVRTTMPDPRPMLAHFERHFARALERAGAAADRVIVAHQPWFAPPYTPAEAAHMWHGGAGQAWREKVATYYSFEVVSRLMALLNARAARVAEAHGAEQIDLMRLLPRGLDTYYDGFHATPAGARIVASAVAATILGQPGLQTLDTCPPQPRAGQRSEDATCALA
jgi:lysophospholipase L1-like esterase